MTKQDDFSPEKISKAIALFYDGENTPVVSAKGVGANADEIIRIAQENNVPLCDNSLLVELLAQLELGESIPSALYTAIAQILAFAYQLEMDNQGPAQSD